MPASSPLAIATNAVTRLLKEQEYYRKDHAAQQNQLNEIKKNSSGGDDSSNDGYLIKQRETALSETEAVLKRTPENVRAAKDKLESLLTGTGEQEAAEVEKAEEAIAQANQSLKD